MLLNTKSLDIELGSSQYAFAVDSASLSITGDMTIECWVKLESSPSSGNQYTFISKYITTGNQRSYSFGYYNNGGTPEIGLTISSDGSGTTVNKAIPYTLSTGVWTHVVATYDASAGSMEIFVNGLSIGTNTGLPTSIYNSTAIFQIGIENTGSYFDGLIDEVRVWNDIRTDAEILDNYQKELFGDEAGLVAYYKFNDSALDETTNNNDLTLMPVITPPIYSTDIPDWTLLRDLISYWKLDESSGNAADSVASNTLTNNNTATYSAGKINNGVDLEKDSSQSLSITDASQTGLDISGDFTISAWIKVESDPANGEYRPIAGKWDADGNQRGYYFEYHKSGGGIYRIGCLISNNGTDISEHYTSGIQFTTGVWYHVAMTYDVSVGVPKFYVNGVYVGESSSGKTSIYNNTAPFVIGETDGAYFDGMIDEVGIWSRVLTPFDIFKLFCFRSGWQHPFEDKLIVPAKTSDSWIQNTGATYSTVRNAATGGSVTISDLIYAQNTKVDATYYVSRSNICFDVSELPDDATINSAIIELYTADISTPGSGNIDIVEYTGQDTPTTADYDQFGTDIFCAIADTSINTDAYNEFDLDSDGKALIVNTQDSKFSIRHSLDIANTEPSTHNQIGFYTSNRTSINERPYLLILYSTDSTLYKTLTDVAVINADFDFYIPKVFNEVISIISTKLVKYIKIFSEIINIIDPVISKLKLTIKSITEVIVTTDIYSNIKALKKILIDTILVTGNIIKNFSIRIFTEIISITSNFGRVSLTTLSEIVSVVHISVNRTFSKIFSEAVIIIDNIITIFNRERTFTEVITVGVSRIKFILNGIEVGIWKRIARVVNGVWKKINRNDN